MSLLVRKFDRGKWLQTDIENGEDVSADAITLCMRTSGNKLSVWEIKQEEDIDEAVLAIVAGCDHLEAFDIVTINLDYIKKNGIGLSSTDGPTAVDDLKDTHRDLCELTYKKLGVIAYYIVDKITQKKTRRYTKVQLKTILSNAISHDRLELDKLSSFIREKLR